MRKLLLLFWGVLPFSIFAQDYRVPINGMSEISVNKTLDNSDTLVHMAIKPFWLPENYHLEFEKTLINGSYRSPKRRFVGRKIFDEHFGEVVKNDFVLRIDPLLEVHGGRDLDAEKTKNLTTNIRGFQLSGNIQKKVSFYTSYYESQSFFPSYVDSFALSSQVIPGFGRYKEFGTTGYDYNLVTGLFRYNASKHIQFTFGQDKLFFGHGYRSVLLSDNSFSYPFLGINIVGLKGKLQYSTNYAWLQKVERTPRVTTAEALLKRKQANFHYLSFKPNKKIEIGVFEGIIWKRWDETKGTIDVGTAFYAPVLFASEIVSSKEENFNKINGINLLVQPFKHFNLYSQFAFNSRDNAYQLGAKWNAPLGLESWFTQVEYNRVGEEVYNANEYENVNYTHYSQGLGTFYDNYNELIGVLRFHKSYWWAEGKLNWMQFDNDLSPVKSIQILQGELGYIINPKYNLTLYSGGILRSPDKGESTAWFYAGIKTNLTNRYFDF